MKNKPRIKQKTLTSKSRNDRPPVEPQRLGQGIVDGGAVITELLPQRLLSLGLVEKGA
jgi:hypothetical protein